MSIKKAAVRQRNYHKVTGGVCASSSGILLVAVSVSWRQRQVLLSNELVNFLNVACWMHFPYHMLSLLSALERGFE